MIWFLSITLGITLIFLVVFIVKFVNLNNKINGALGYKREENISKEKLVEFVVNNAQHEKDVNLKVDEIKNSNTEEKLKDLVIQKENIDTKEVVPHVANANEPDPSVVNWIDTFNKSGK